MTSLLTTPPEHAVESSETLLAPIQQGMLAAHLTARTPGLDVEQIVCTLPERVDVAALERAWQSIIDANAALRIRIAIEEGTEPRQTVVPELRVPVEWRRSCGLNDDERDAAVARFLAADRRRGFDLEVPPLMRLTLFEFDDADWRLVWSFHHALLDGRAFALVLEDVFDAYDALRDGKGCAPSARAAHTGYGQWLAQRDATADEAFWRDVLRGVTAPTPLPFRSATPRPDVPASADHDVRLSREATQELRALASESRASVGTLVQAAWALVLARHARADDVVFGAVVSCADYGGQDHADALGVCINSVPLRISVPDDARVDEWLRDVRARWDALREHRHLPLPAIQECSDVPRGSALFASLVMYDRYELDERLRSRGGQWSARRFRLYEQNGFPLTIGAYAGESLLLRFEYDPRELGASDVAVLASRVVAALEAFVRDPAQRLADVDLLLPGERTRVLDDWNATATSFELAPLSELIAAQAARTPDAAAVVTGASVTSYRELVQRATALARYLAAEGVGPGTFVGVSIPRSEHLVTALVGVLRAGAAYVPLDPDYPPQRLAHMRDDADLRVILATTETAARLTVDVGASRARVIELDREWARIAAAAAPGAPGAATLDDPAYMIYTSGSTGVPKGAINSHRAIANRLLWMQQTYRLDERDAVLQKTPASFDVSVWEFFWPLITGARLVLAAPGGHRDPAYLRDLILRERVSVMHFVPSMLRAFLDEEEIERCSIGREGALRDVMCSGEALPFELQERFFERLPGVRLHNLYGPTEAAVDVTAWECVPGDARGVVPIGRPIANTRMYVLDAARRPVPVGVPGELYIGGVQVGQGYWRRPELTAERFVVDPFVADSCARMYRTGDLARWSADGTIEYLGRIDEQVKLRGQRIELGEIESALVRQAEVRAAAVALRDDRRGIPELVAYCVPAMAADLAPATRPVLRDRLAELLPAHMLPSAIVWIDALPLGATGKLDRRTLPAPTDDDVIDTAERAVDAPRTDAEATVAAIFAELLGVERVGRTDHFFRLGGDSILLIRAVSAARRAGLVVSLREIAAEPTVAAFAAAAAAPRGIAEQRTAPPRARLTPIQQWFFEANDESRDHWNQALVLRPRASLADDALRTALAKLVERHAALRTRFMPQNGEWMQEVVPFERVAVDFEVVDADALALDYDVALRQIGAAAQQVLSVAGGRLFAARRVSSRANGDVLILVAHHLAVDGVSWRIIAEDLERLCGTGRELAESSAFTTWSEGLHRLAATGVFDAEADFWLNVVHSGTSQLTRDFAPLSPSVAGTTQTVVAALPADVTAELLRDAGGFDAQINAVLLAGLAEALAGCVAGDRIVIDVEGHGREDLLPGVDVGHTVGWFTSMFPIALDVGSRASAAERVRAIDAQLRAMPEHGVGYGILRHLRGNTAIAEVPRDVVFNYFGQLDRDTSDGQLFDVEVRDIGPLRGARTSRRHLLEVNCAVRRGRFEAALEYDSTLLEFRTVGSIASRFVDALARLASGAGERADASRPFERVEAAYALTPLQRLFHAFDSSERDPGLQQWRFRIDGVVDGVALRAAWQDVVDRHPMLRTAFVDEAGSGDPHQIVYRRALLPWAEADLRSLAKSDREAALADVLERDAAIGLPFDRAPMMRITLVRLGDETYEMIWTHHHAALDRWSWPIVLDDVGALYGARRSGRRVELSPPVPFEAYVRWVRRQDAGTAERFWRDTLGDLATVPRFRRPDVAPAPADADISDDFRIDSVRTGALRAAAARMGVPLNALVQGAWALTLAHLLGADDLILGTVVSGRPDDLDDADRIVGAMVANVPVRVRVSSDTDVESWVRGIAQAQFAVQEHAWVAAEQIEEWSGLRGRLVETLIVFHDAAADDVARRWVGSDAVVTDVITPTRTEYPVTLVVGGRDDTVLSLRADARRVAATAIRPILPTLEGMLDALTREVGTVAELLATLPQRDRGLAAPTAENHPADAGEGASWPCALEHVLADLWRDVLDVQVRPGDTFFALGGNSLGAMKLASRIAEVLRVRLPIRAIFAAPTVAQLAEAVRASAGDRRMPDRIAELVRRVSAMSDAEVGSTLGDSRDTALTGTGE